MSLDLKRLTHQYSQCAWNPGHACP